MNTGYQFGERQVSELIPYANNARTHSPEQVKQIAASITEFGFTNPILIDEHNGLIAGHGRLLAANLLKLQNVPVFVLNGLTEYQKKAYILADNQLALNAGWDEELLKLELEFLQEGDFDIDLIAFDDDFLDLLSENEEQESQGSSGKVGSLADKFILPPFSIFNSRTGWWQERKRAWLELGIQSEVGRDEGLTISALSTSQYTEKNEIEKKLGRKLSTEEYKEKYCSLTKMSTTSIFDPVLTELCYEWFCPNNGHIVDPFAGGSVRGVVASRTNRKYTGNDLREEQVLANREQADSICVEPKPHWTIGDSVELETLIHEKADMIFSCPPYADLEKYSDNPKDLSNMSYEDFLAGYRKVIQASFNLLKNDRFAAWVVGEVRDKNGVYLNFVGDTITAFIDAGFSYYNEAILVNVVGSLPIRVGKQFSQSRKLGKTHQNVLVFVKGDPKKAALACGDIEVHLEDPEDTEQEE
ncbi:ParB/Srx family N-terminal domain-containing protein [Vibrio ziniensis]|uniref:ParB N-terminal domain-containing protein n=1 Tax=Vibrio ziniensis TaxID=2711221 RepID=A0A6G7CN40_9VIBR|nr:ParB/Srx family N-terminal domain-containing protein [Vibrio ziniensis]QIH43463.1 ParB N-terminal domain-containing protein [Vibrio ziniensis]